MSYPINYPTPQGANIQIFKEGGSDSDWVKPQGASFVWFTLIGAGSAGETSIIAGGGSGVVTNFMGPAFLMPDVLRVTVGKGGQTDAASGTDSTVIYQQKDGTGYTLLTASGALGGYAFAMTPNAFTAMGFFQSVNGVAVASGASTASATTFLSRGGTSGATSSNYGYSSAKGYFQMQPIIVGVGGGASGGLIGDGGIGCGGGTNGSNFGAGGDGMVVIITW
jgi:hypothetical protein